MKSIKEKSLESYPDKKVVLARGNTCLSCGRVKRESFEAGADYVLEEVESIIKDESSGLVEMWDKLMTLVEQLKK